MSDRKIGEGSLKAALRQEHKEIGRALPAFPDSIQAVEEPGTFGYPTTYDVSKQTGAVETKEDHEYGQVEAVESKQSLKSQLAGSVYGKPATKEAELEREPQPEPEYEPS